VNSFPNRELIEWNYSLKLQVVAANNPKTAVLTNNSATEIPNE